MMLPDGILKSMKIKNIIFAYNYDEKSAGSEVRFRIYEARYNYNKFYDKVIQLNYIHGVKQNLLYLYILDQAIMKYYNHQETQILDVYKENGKYQVVNYHYDYLSLNIAEWEYIDNAWKQKQVFFLWNFTDMHKINLLTHRSSIDIQK